METLGVALPLAFAAGVNFYLTVLVIGLSIPLGVVEKLPPGLERFAAWPVVVVAGVLFVIEFFADKIPYLDLVWNFIHTVIRPIGALLIVSSIVVPVDPNLSTVALLVASATALITHSTKTSARVLINTSPEPLTNIFASLVEDAGVAVLVVFTLRNPYLALAVTLGLLAAILLLMPWLLGWVGFWLRAMVALLKSLLRIRRAQGEALPGDFVKLLDGRQPEWTAHCYCRGFSDANGKSGCLSLLSDSLSFSYTKFPARKRVRQLPLKAIQVARLHHHLLFEVLDLTYQIDRQKSRHVRFVFLKDYALLAQQLTDKLAAGLSAQRVKP